MRPLELRTGSFEVTIHRGVDTRRDRPAAQDLGVIHLILVGEVRLEQIEIGTADDLVAARPSDVQEQRRVHPPEDPFLVLDPEQDVLEIVEQLKNGIRAGAERPRRRFECRFGHGEAIPGRPTLPRRSARIL
jgi:hypothetical protein